MFCGHCGKKLPDGARFCIECGAPVKLTSEQKEQRRSQQEPPDRDRGDQETALYHSEGFPPSFLTVHNAFAVFCMIVGAGCIVLSQMREHASQMKFYTNGVLEHTGTLGGGYWFDSSGRQMLLWGGIAIIVIGITLIPHAQSRNRSYALTLYPSRITGIRQHEKFSLEYSQVLEATSGMLMSHPFVKIVTTRTAYLIIVQKDAEKAAEIIRSRVGAYYASR